jgi:hypothetical protein
MFVCVYNRERERKMLQLCSKTVSCKDAELIRSCQYKSCIGIRWKQVLFRGDVSASQYVSCSKCVFSVALCCVVLRCIVASLIVSHWLNCLSSLKFLHLTSHFMFWLMWPSSSWETGCSCSSQELTWESQPGVPAAVWQICSRQYQGTHIVWLPCMCMHYSHYCALYICVSSLKLPFAVKDIFRNLSHMILGPCLTFWFATGLAHWVAPPRQRLSLTLSYWSKCTSFSFNCLILQIKKEELKNI